MTEEGISLTQDELDKVLSGVRQDNEKNEEKIVGQTSAAISQAELDLLFGSSHSTMKKIEPKAEEEQPEEEASSETAEEEESGASVSPSPDGRKKTMEEKIAERKARMEALLAQVNAQSPKRISVVYGSTLTTGDKISNYKRGSIIELDREPGSDVDILCDGKLIARGIVGNFNGKTAVKITFMID